MNAASIQSLVASRLPQRARWLFGNTILDFSRHNEPRNLTAEFLEWGLSDADVADIEHGSDLIVFVMWDFDEGGGATPALAVRQSDGKVFDVDVEASDLLSLLNSSLEAFIKGGPRAKFPVARVRQLFFRLALPPRIAAGSLRGVRSQRNDMAQTNDDAFAIFIDCGRLHETDPNRKATAICYACGVRHTGVCAVRIQDARDRSTTIFPLCEPCYDAPEKEDVIGRKYFEGARPHYEGRR